MNRNRNTDDLVRPGLCTSVKKNLPAIRRKLRKKTPALSYKDLRRARESYYSSKIQELYEEGYAMVAEFMEETELMESEQHARAPEGLQLKHLYDAPEMLNNLIKALQIAEELDNIVMSSEAVLSLLQLGNEFANGIDDFKWIAERIISKALSISDKIALDDGRTKATVLCSMGKLYAQNSFYENANQQFQMAWDICSGKDWTVSKTDTTFLSRLICLEYCSSLDHCAQELSQRPSDYYRAKLICSMAIKMAKMSGSFTILADAYSSYGRILSSMKLFDKALEMFDSSVTECRSSGDLEKVAVAELSTADCLYSLKKYDDSLRRAKRANTIATNNKFLKIEARSLELMAQADQSLGNNIVATEEYTKASEIYQDLGQGEDMLEMQCFAAISKARDIIEPYIELILKSDNEKFGENKYMAMNLDWELRREPFWDSVIDGKPVVSMTDTTFSAPEEALKVPNTVTSRISNPSSISLASSRNLVRRRSVFLECIREEQNMRSQ